MGPDLYPHKFEVSIPLPRHIEKRGPECNFKPGEKSLKASLNALRDVSVTFVYLHGEDEMAQVMVANPEGFVAQHDHFRHASDNSPFPNLRQLPLSCFDLEGQDTPLSQALPGPRLHEDTRRSSKLHCPPSYRQLRPSGLQQSQLLRGRDADDLWQNDYEAVHHDLDPCCVDLTHDPELSICEFQMAYADCDITGSLAEGIGMKDLTGGKTMPKYHPESRGSEKAFELSFRRPWARSRQERETLEEIFQAGETLRTEEASKFLRGSSLREMQRAPDECASAGLARWRVYQPSLHLSRLDWSRLGLCEHFEGLFYAKTFYNAYTELNWPFEQRLQFEEQVRHEEEGDDEA
ncbi:uncharacterized protein PHACADRAFT_210605 [Phanerochaete carnosa HHB-10118-sp]|uniref:Uncharacterized protein n=1 Tax=Phanerochaete carnosa (strain HHB-10118-sp) TaxID=650164 RepID=K5W6S8_PHACS|nr:uncharacterized protein PHACADRAFT_210605 [Phanerochaete carnosa HHB-10118-sp]EKM54830.1 hypothetical protein PHACADRAFT_210605 [Phanerochaete carnosa HHB-10118-sp]